MTIHFIKAATNFAEYKLQFNFLWCFPSRLCGTWVLICDLQVFGIQVQSTNVILRQRRWHAIIHCMEENKTWMHAVPR